MSYQPSKYRHFFPLGLFDAPEKLTTWEQSHRLFALNQVRQKGNSLKVTEGLILKKGHIEFGKGFSNYQCWEIDPFKRKVAFLYAPKGVYPINIFKKTPKCLVCTTLGYFYLTTNEEEDEVSPPVVRVNNFFVFNGRLYQLPVVDRSTIIITKPGGIILKFLKAKGTLKIGNVEYRWRGGKAIKDKMPVDEVVVYTASSGKIEPYIDPIIGPGRLAKKVSTPPKRVDFVIRNIRGRMKIVKISPNGKTLVGEGHMVLSFPKKLGKKIPKGELLSKITVDGLNVENIQHAVSIGPKTFKNDKKRIQQLEIEGHDNDEFLCNRIHEEGKKAARGCLVELKDGRLVVVLIDGIPQAGEIYPGVTPRELVNFVSEKYPDKKHVFAIDPGATMKSVHRGRNNQTIVFGNTHYLKYKYFPDGRIKFAPNGIRGRKAYTFLGVF